MTNIDNFYNIDCKNISNKINFTSQNSHLTTPQTNNPIVPFLLPEETEEDIKIAKAVKAGYLDSSRELISDYQNKPMPNVDDYPEINKAYNELLNTEINSECTLRQFLIKQRDRAKELGKPIKYFEVIGTKAFKTAGNRYAEDTFASAKMRSVYEDGKERLQKEPNDTDIRTYFCKAARSDNNSLIRGFRALPFFEDSPPTSEPSHSLAWEDIQELKKKALEDLSDVRVTDSYCDPNVLIKYPQKKIDYLIGKSKNFCLFDNSCLHGAIYADSLDEDPEKEKLRIVFISEDGRYRNAYTARGLGIISDKKSKEKNYSALIPFVSSIVRGEKCFNKQTYIDYMTAFYKKFRNNPNWPEKLAEMIQSDSSYHWKGSDEAKILMLLQFEMLLQFAPEEIKAHFDVTSLNRSWEKIKSLIDSTDSPAYKILELRIQNISTSVISSAMACMSGVFLSCGIKRNGPGTRLPAFTEQLCVASIEIPFSSGAKCYVPWDPKRDVDELKDRTDLSMMLTPILDSIICENVSYDVSALFKYREYLVQIDDELIQKAEEMCLGEAPFLQFAGLSILLQAYAMGNKHEEEFLLTKAIPRLLASGNPDYSRLAAEVARHFIRNNAPASQNDTMENLLACLPNISCWYQALARCCNRSFAFIALKQCENLQCWHDQFPSSFFDALLPYFPNETVMVLHKYLAKGKTLDRQTVLTIKSVVESERTVIYCWKELLEIKDRLQQDIGLKESVIKKHLSLAEPEDYSGYTESLLKSCQTMPNHSVMLTTAEFITSPANLRDGNAKNNLKQYLEAIDDHHESYSLSRKLLSAQINAGIQWLSCVPQESHEKVCNALLLLLDKGIERCIPYDSCYALLEKMIKHASFTDNNRLGSCLFKFLNAHIDKIHDPNPIVDILNTALDRRIITLDIAKTRLLIKIAQKIIDGNQKDSLSLLIKLVNKLICIPSAKNTKGWNALLASLHALSETTYSLELERLNAKLTCDELAFDHSLEALAMEIEGSDNNAADTFLHLFNSWEKLTEAQKVRAAILLTSLFEIDPVPVKLIKWLEHGQKMGNTWLYCLLKVVKNNPSKALENLLSEHLVRTKERSSLSAAAAAILVKSNRPWNDLEAYYIHLNPSEEELWEKSVEAIYTNAETKIKLGILLHRGCPESLRQNVKTLLQQTASSKNFSSQVIELVNTYRSNLDDADWSILWKGFIQSKNEAGIKKLLPNKVAGQCTDPLQSLAEILYVLNHLEDISEEELLLRIGKIKEAEINIETRIQACQKIASLALGNSRILNAIFESVNEIDRTGAKSKEIAEFLFGNLNKVPNAYDKQLVVNLMTTFSKVDTINHLNVLKWIKSLKPGSDPDKIDQLKNQLTYFASKNASITSKKDYQTIISEVITASSKNPVLLTDILKCLIHIPKRDTVSFQEAFNPIIQKFLDDSNKAETKNKIDCLELYFGCTQLYNIEQNTILAALDLFVTASRENHHADIINKYLDRFYSSWSKIDKRMKISIKLSLLTKLEFSSWVSETLWISQTKGTQNVLKGLFSSYKDFSEDQKYELRKLLINIFFHTFNLNSNFSTIFKQFFTEILKKSIELRIIFDDMLIRKIVCYNGLSVENIKSSPQEWARIYFEIINTLKGSSPSIAKSAAIIIFKRILPELSRASAVDLLDWFKLVINYCKEGNTSQNHYDIILMLTNTFSKFTDLNNDFKLSFISLLNLLFLDIKHTDDYNGLYNFNQIKCFAGILNILDPYILPKDNPQLHAEISSIFTDIIDKVSELTTLYLNTLNIDIPEEKETAVNTIKNLVSHFFYNTVCLDLKKPAFYLITLLQGANDYYCACGIHLLLHEANQRRIFSSPIEIYDCMPVDMALNLAVGTLMLEPSFPIALRKMADSIKSESNQAALLRRIDLFVHMVISTIVQISDSDYKAIQIDFEADIIHAITKYSKANGCMLSAYYLTVLLNNQALDIGSRSTKLFFREFLEEITDALEHEADHENSGMKNSFLDFVLALTHAGYFRNDMIHGGCDLKEKVQNYIGLATHHKDVLVALLIEKFWAEQDAIAPKDHSEVFLNKLLEAELYDHFKIIVPECHVALAAIGSKVLKRSIKITLKDNQPQKAAKCLSMMQSGAISKLYSLENLAADILLNVINNDALTDASTEIGSILVQNLNFKTPPSESVFLELCQNGVKISKKCPDTQVLIIECLLKWSVLDNKNPSEKAYCALAHLLIKAGTLAAPMVANYGPRILSLLSQHFPLSIAHMKWMNLCENAKETERVPKTATTPAADIPSPASSDSPKDNWIHYLQSAAAMANLNRLNDCCDFTEKLFGYAKEHPELCLPKEHVELCKRLFNYFITSRKWCLAAEIIAFTYNKQHVDPEVFRNWTYHIINSACNCSEYLVAARLVIDYIYKYRLEDEKFSDITHKIFQKIDQPEIIREAWKAAISKGPYLYTLPIMRAAIRTKTKLTFCDFNEFIFHIREQDIAQGASLYLTMHMKQLASPSQTANHLILTRLTIDDERGSEVDTYLVGQITSDSEFGIMHQCLMKEAEKKLNKDEQKKFESALLAFIEKGIELGFKGNRTLDLLSSLIKKALEQPSLELDYHLIAYTLFQQSTELHALAFNIFEKARSIENSKHFIKSLVKAIIYKNDIQYFSKELLLVKSKSLDNQLINTFALEISSKNTDSTNIASKIHIIKSLFSIYGRSKTLELIKKGIKLALVLDDVAKTQEYIEELRLTCKEDKEDKGAVKAELENTFEANRFSKLLWEQNPNLAFEIAVLETALSVRTKNNAITKKCFDIGYQQFDKVLEKGNKTTSIIAFFHLLASPLAYSTFWKSHIEKCQEYYQKLEQLSGIPKEYQCLKYLYLILLTQGKKDVQMKTNKKSDLDTHQRNQLRAIDLYFRLLPKAHEWTCLNCKILILSSYDSYEVNDNILIDNYYNILTNTERLLKSTNPPEETITNIGEILVSDKIVINRLKNNKITEAYYKLAKEFINKLLNTELLDSLSPSLKKEYLSAAISFITVGFEKGVFKNISKANEYYSLIDKLVILIEKHYFNIQNDTNKTIILISMLTGFITLNPDDVSSWSGHNIPRKSIVERATNWYKILARQEGICLDFAKLALDASGFTKNIFSEHQQEFNDLKKLLDEQKSSKKLSEASIEIITQIFTNLSKAHEAAVNNFNVVYTEGQILRL